MGRRFSCLIRHVSLSCLLLVALAVPAGAHPGHGSIDSDHPLHYLADPAHATPWMILFTAVVLALVAFRWARRASQS